MCEIFGINSNIEKNIQPYVTTFFSHSDKNPHGWGSALLDEAVPKIRKEACSASCSQYVKEQLMSDLYARNTLVHIREATIGHVEYENCHPFVRKDKSGRYWTLIHNGTIFDFSALNPYAQMQEGETDSERILMYIVDRINSAAQNIGNPLNPQQRSKVIDHVLMNMAYMNKLNILLYDGSQLYVHTNYRNSLYMLQDPDSVLFATKPLSDENWQPVPFMQVLTFSSGQCIYEGMKHPFEFLDDKRAMELLYLAFSGL